MQQWEDTEYLTIAATAKVITKSTLLGVSFMSAHRDTPMQHFVGYAFDSDFAAGGNDSDARFSFDALISPADMRQVHRRACACRNC